jgi:LacI family transcriptional regulator/LacI family repressor for deo operon, udp, cdd, tsx, nupC, and nupG
MAIVETFHRRRVDGILVAASRITGNYKNRLAHIQVPTVLINSQAESEVNVLHWVSIDDRMGAQLAVEHLLKLGHRSVGYLGISARPRSNRHRLLGYQSALAAAGVPCRDEWVVIAPGSEASQEEDVAAGQSSLPRLLDAGVTATFCYNDMTAIGVLMACRELGIAVPQEISVIGFDDITMASYVTPPLTTIQQPKVQLGRLATQVVLDLLNNHPGCNHMLSPTLILRASTAPLAGSLAS